jgi:hypothetical protein
MEGLDDDGWYVPERKRFAPARIISRGGGSSSTPPRGGASGGGGSGGQQATHDVAGLRVAFPFTPYPCQLDFMATVITALQRGENALLESPTGTGKTLCLLCSCLAWQQQQAGSGGWGVGGGSDGARAAAMELLGGGPGGGLGGGSTAGGLGSSSSAAAGGGGGGNRPTLFYASRTHSQLSQVQATGRPRASRHMAPDLGEHGAQSGVSVCCICFSRLIGHTFDVDFDLI